MKKKKIILVFLSVIVALVILVPMFTTPMRRPHSVLRWQILRSTPIGTGMDDVIEFVEREYGWGSPGVSFDYGFAQISPGSRRPPPAHLGFPDHPRVGVMSVSSYMGSYRNWFMFFVTSVTVFWGFDEDGKLIDVYIWKVSGG